MPATVVQFPGALVPPPPTPAESDAIVAEAFAVIRRLADIGCLAHVECLISLGWKLLEAAE